MVLDYVAMGRRIRRKRQETGLTQVEFAKLINLSPSFYGHIERGARTPSLETLVLIANQLRIGTDQLLRDSLVTPVINDKTAFFNTKDLHMLRSYLSMQSQAIEHWLDENDVGNDDHED